MKLLRYIGNFRTQREELVRDEIVNDLLKTNEWELVEDEKPKLKKIKEIMNDNSD